jgi:Predicted aminopeptidases
MMRGWVWIGVLLGVCALAFGQQKVDVEKVQARYRQLVGAVSDARLAETVRWMAAQGSRVAGYPGADRAADYIEQQFRTLGLQNVRREAFPITVPIDEEAHLHLNGQKLRVYPLWPNQARTSHLPPDGIRGNLIYVRDGQLQQFRGKPVEGSIVLMDFNTGNNWLNAARLGARAIVFIEPETTTRGEAEAKFIGIPLDVPRFWLPRQHAAKLIALAETQPDLQAKLTCRMPWQVLTGYNIVGVLPGSDPALKDQWIVITAYYDSISIVPSLAPGAENATGIAAMLELARLFKKYPPKRSVMFVANGAHFQALEGIRQFIERRLPEWSRPNVLERVMGDRRQPPDIYLFVGLDLASRSRGVGVFYKGWFYDMREDIQRYFSELGRVLREHADRIAPVLGTAASKLFADGINNVQGRYWRTYIPGKPAFDAEAATLAGAWGITFATIEDARPLVDTPLDTFENCNIANIALQTRTIACLFHHILNDTNERGATGPRFPIR